MYSRIDARITKNIQERIREQVYMFVKRWCAEQEQISMFEEWKKSGCADVETINKTIWKNDSRR